jgi:hypothetical protein
MITTGMHKRPIAAIGIAHHREKRSAQHGLGIEAAETDNSDPAFLHKPLCDHAAAH